MEEYIALGNTLPEAYHKALWLLNKYGKETPCQDWNTSQKELSMTIVVENPLQEPMISRLFIGGPKELEQYRQEMLDGILDFEISKGNWKYTYHNRITWYHIAEDEWANQVEFVIDELKRNPSSRRAVIDVRYNYDDMYSDDPACFVSGTLIDTPNGCVRVENIKNGDTVYAYDLTSDTKMEAKVSNVFHKQDDILTIYTDFGSIGVSKNQLMLTETGWKQACALNTKDRILWCGSNTDSDRFFHLVGCLYGDGWLTKPTQKYHTDGTTSGIRRELGFSVHPQADESPILRLFKTFTNNTVKFRSNFVKSEVVKNGGISKKTEISDVSLYDSLFDYVPSGKKTNSVVKLTTKDMSKQDIIDFLTALYSCEGSIAKRSGKGHSIQIAMNWRECIDLVDEMLNVLEIKHTSFKKKIPWSIHVENYDGITAFCNSGIDFRFDSRKQIKFAKLKAQYKIMNEYNIKNIPTIDAVEKINSMFVPIKAIANMGTATVYDFTVEHPDHAIVANGFIAHNCLQHIQYFIRDNKLHCKVLFRSNDACKATFMNAFALIMLQKRIADKLEIEVGSYTHRANSFHCYARDYDMLEGYCKRIKNSGDKTYNYIGDWDELMKDAKPEIADMVQELKNKVNDNE